LPHTTPIGRRQKIFSVFLKKIQGNLLLLEVVGVDPVGQYTCESDGYESGKDIFYRYPRHKDIGLCSDQNQKGDSYQKEVAYLFADFTGLICHECVLSTRRKD
tara:strand:- start:434 stop:742 length:309 start_codon:yes stop_codon:yes gene_type:complete